MPFTPSHAIVALPFVGTRLARAGFVPAAVAVGAMAPDLPLFVHGTPLRYAVTHDLAWLPLTALVALALLLVWRGVLRPAVRELSPRWLAARLPVAWDEGGVASVRETLEPGRRGIRLVLLAVALALGVVTHIVWDAFTHEGRAGSALLPALADEWGPLPGYRWLQYGSSVGGVVVLAVAAVVWLRHRTPTPVRRAVPSWVRIAWWASLPVLCAVGFAAFTPEELPLTPEQLAYDLLPPLAAGWALATAALCLAVQARVKAAERGIADA